MKKITISLLIFLFIVIVLCLVDKNKTYKVLKVVDAQNFYVDLNKNNVVEEDEIISLQEYNGYDKKLSKIDSARLSYLSNKFAQKTLAGKNIEIINKQIILPDRKNYKNELIDKGLIVGEDNFEQVKKNLDYAKSLNLVSYNTISHNFHKLTCEYALNSQNVVIMNVDELPKDAIPCKVCHLAVKKEFLAPKKYPREVFEPYQPVYKDNFIEFYVTDFTKYYYPSTKCSTTPCKSLLKRINDAKTSIDFAIYGLDREPEIAESLLKAQNRGVSIRWIYDTDKKGNTIYLDTFKLLKTLKNGKSDNDVLLEPSQKNYKDAIMHNKFFIFDDKYVWTGSANITFTDLSGFNANSAILINSSEIAKIYKAEFEQMYSGKFHKLKSKTPVNHTCVGSTEIQVRFSPQDNAIETDILPLIKSARKYIYVPVFVITHKGFNEALIDAKKRGVDVKVIVDATNASGKYSSVKTLREAKVPVKAENRPGKMHMKSIMIDDTYTVMGSMNFTKSGEKYNDENVLILKNPALTKAFKTKFSHIWKEIPDKWLTKNPGAESWNSINSCFDGVDNDFDGKIDMQDDSCNFKLKKDKKAS